LAKTAADTAFSDICNPLLNLLDEDSSWIKLIASEASNYSVEHVRRGGLAGAENKNKFYDVF
jgi:hypothetical protein